MAATQYATSTDFGKYGLPAGALDGFAGDINDLLKKASGKVDGYLRGRYSCPLASPYPDEIVEAVCVIAAHSLLNVRGFDPNSDSDMAVRQRYEDLCGRPMQPGWLERIAQGRITLDTTADTTTGTQEGAPIVLGTSSTRCARHQDYGHSSDNCWRFW